MLFSLVATSHTWLLRAGNMASVTEELGFRFYLIVMNINLSGDSQLGLLAMDWEAQCGDTGIRR